MPSATHPWNVAIWARLTRSAERHTHAWLFSGAHGLGKTTTAIQFAEHLLTHDTPDQTRPRRLFRAIGHPDLHVLMPEELYLDNDELLESYAVRYPPTQTQRSKPKTVITVDQVRQLIQGIATRSHAGGNKCIVITPADRMNLNAANALLKILEEPPDATAFILVTASPQRLPATIRSRCTPVAFRIPAKPRALSWLEQQGVPGTHANSVLSLAGGAPLRALGLYKTGYLSARDAWLEDVLQLIEGGTADPLTVAAKWNQHDVQAAIGWLQATLVDLIRFAFSAAPPSLYDPDASLRLQDVRKHFNLRDGYRLLDEINQAKQLLQTTADANLTVESVLIDLRRVTASVGERSNDGR